MTPKFDYRDLLMKYMGHIAHREATAYVDGDRDEDDDLQRRFTEDEWTELQNIDRALRSLDR